MKLYNIPEKFSLQLFAEGGAGGAAGAAGDGGTAGETGATAAAAVQQKGVKGNPLASVKYGIQEESAPAAEVQQQTTQDLTAEFDKLIKGQFKSQYDAKVQDTIAKRLKGANSQIADLQGKQSALDSIVQVLASKHGVDPTDIAGLKAAIDADDSYFEQEAIELGMSVKQLKEVRRMRAENAELREKMQAQKQQETVNRQLGEWMRQAEEAKKIYPSLDLNAELKNPTFQSLLKSNIDVRTAYQVIHQDEIIPAAMQHAAKAVEEKLARSMASGGRPAENGVTPSAPALVKNDVSQLTKADRQEIIRRVQRGEKIRF